MASLRYVVPLFAILSVGFALNCYTEVTLNKQKPTVYVPCPMSQYCEKKSATSGSNTANTYYCGNSAECSKEGCTSANGITTCCCSKDLCNGSSKLPVLLTLIPVMLAKVFF